MCFKFLKHNRPFSHMFHFSFFALVRLCRSGTDVMASTLLRALWLIIGCRRADGAKNESQAKEVNVFTFLFSGRAFLLVLLVLILSWINCKRKNKSNCPRVLGRHSFQYCNYQNLNSSEEYQRISLGSQLAPQKCTQDSLHGKAQESVKRDIVKHQLGLFW